MVFLGTLTIKAQTEKGSFLVNGNTSFSFSKKTQKIKEYDSSITSFKENLFGIEISGGYFILNNLAGGINLGYTNRKYRGDETKVFNIGPYVRYYFASKKIKPFIEGAYLFGKEKYFYKNANEIEKKINTYSGSFGVAFFIFKNVSFDVAAQYVYSKPSSFSGYEYYNSRFNFRTGFSFFLN